MGDAAADGDNRVIRTARTEGNINTAARSGFFPLVKEVEPSPTIKSKLRGLPEFGDWRNLCRGRLSSVTEWNTRD